MIWLQKYLYRRVFTGTGLADCWIEWGMFYEFDISFIFPSIWFSAVFGSDNKTRKHVIYALPEWRVMACPNDATGRQQYTGNGMYQQPNNRKPHGKKMSERLKCLKPFMERFLNSSLWIQFSVKNVGFLD